MKRAIIFILLTCVCYLSIRPLLALGFFSMHDDTQVARVITMQRALAQGQVPVRWVADLGYGYGYPLYNFYGPLPYYVGGLLHTSGLSALVATKLMFILGVVGLGISTFALVAAFAGIPAGIVSATLAQLAPYHAVQIYVRGAVGEFWATACIPLILLGFLWCADAKTAKKGIGIGIVGLVGTILSHTLSGYIVMLASIVFVAVYALWCIVIKKYIDRRRFISYLTMIIMSLGLSAFFWLPAFGEMQYTSVAGQIGPTADFRNHFVCLSQLWDSSWGFGGSIPGCIDGLSFKLGKIHILLAILGIVAWSRSKKGHTHVLSWTSMVIVCAAIFLLSRQSVWLWQHIPDFAYIQYPWRFLSYAGIGLAILGGLVVARKETAGVWIVTLVLVTAIVGYNTKLFVPQTTYQKSDTDFETANELRFRASKVSDEYLPKEIIRPTSEEGIVFATIEASTGATISKVVDTAINAQYTISASAPVTIRINRAYFPGWQYWINSKRVDPSIRNGLPELILPKGTSTVTMHFANTPIRTVANGISLLSLIGCIAWYGTTKKTNS